jgi:hypothetical protein
MRANVVCFRYVFFSDVGWILRLRREEKLGPAVIARRVGIGRASVYRLLGKPAAIPAKGGVDADQG